jgi:hypothetical protein
VLRDPLGKRGSDTIRFPVTTELSYVLSADSANACVRDPFSSFQRIGSSLSLSLSLANPHRSATAALSLQRKEECGSRLLKLVRQCAGCLSRCLSVVFVRKTILRLALRGKLQPAFKANNLQTPNGKMAWELEYKLILGSTHTTRRPKYSHNCLRAIPSSRVQTLCSHQEKNSSILQQWLLVP